MPYKGKFKPQNPLKYKGDITNIIYRSSWELKFMHYCDMNSSILEWGSEEIFIPYISPVDGKRHRYFPDFYAKIEDHKGKITKYLIEIKPHKQTLSPPTQNRITKRYINEVTTYAVNDAKWKAAKAFCDLNEWEFKIITEHQLKV